MPRVPPVVIYRPTGGAAYLLAWERLPDRPGWWAHIMWIEYKDEHTIHGAEARVHQRDVGQMQGQDYRSVPRHRPKPTLPSDPTDPRDPDYQTRRHAASEQARLQQQSRRDEPDF
jgi:hypothetical protein